MRETRSGRSPGSPTEPSPSRTGRTLLPPRTVVRDLRLEADTEAVLAMLDDVEERGLGLPTAVVVTQTGDLHRIRAIFRGRVTLYASRGATA